MIINHNMSAAFSNRMLGERGREVQSSIEKLSSGERINKGGDDASGLAVSEKLRSQVRGLNQASANIQNAVSFIQTTEGYLRSTTDVLQRMRELSVQSANGIYSGEDRMQIQVEVSQLVSEVNRIASQAQFNGMNLLTGKFGAGGAGIDFQVGANMDQRVKAFVGNMSAGSLGIGAGQGAAKGISISTADGANTAIGLVDTALKTVSKQRADLGAYQNRFEMAKKGIDNAAENLQASESQIRDTDMAKQMVDFVRGQILVQAGSSMLAQANTQNQSVMKLLG
jgi:flagellin